MRHLIVFLTATLWAWPNMAVLAADPPSIEAFLGSWQGRPDSPAAGALQPQALSLDVRRDADGFRLSWRDFGARDRADFGSMQTDVRFLPTDRTGVYAYSPERGSLLTRMFASPVTGNPLEGETLLWARIDGSTLALYSMRIDNSGDFDLDQYSWTLVESRLQFRFDKQTEDLSMETKFEGELVAKGE